jgi:NADH-quinone oxidoreductase subunit G
VQRQTGPFFIATAASTQLDEVATSTYRAAPDDIARLGFAVAHALHHEAPAVTDLAPGLDALVAAIAQALRAAARPLVIASLSLGSEAVLQAAANVAWSLCREGHQADLCIPVPECNSLGLGLMGGERLDAALQAVQDGVTDTVIILENDLYRRADAASVNAFLDACRQVIVLDHVQHPTTERADVVLPAGTFAEADGTLVSHEGRAQRFMQVFVPEGDIQESWRWLRDIMIRVGQHEATSWQDLDDIIAALASAIPVFANMPEIAPGGDFRIVDQKIPRQPHRYSGRTAILAHRTVHEPKPPPDPDTPLAFSMEGYTGQPPSSLIPFIWAPAWSSPQAINKFQSEVGGPLRGGDPGLRLLEPSPTRDAAFFQAVPAAFTPRAGAWLLVPLYHIFGSEELSALSPAVAQRAAKPHLTLHPDDAAALQVAPEDAVVCQVADTVYRLPVRLDAALPPGLAGLPAGWQGVAGLDVPTWGTLSTGTRA